MGNVKLDALIEGAEANLQAGQVHFAMDYAVMAWQVACHRDDGEVVPFENLKLAGDQLAKVGAELRRRTT